MTKSAVPTPPPTDPLASVPDWIRDTFPDATGSPTPDTPMSLFKVGLRDSWYAKQPWWILGVGSIILGPLALLALPDVMWIGGTIGAVGLLGVIIACWIIFSKAQEAFWNGYAQARGLTPQKKGHLSAQCPLYQKGDRREFDWVLTGNIAGVKAHLALYEYKEVTRTDDGEQETSYPFTVVHFTLPAEVAKRFHGVYARKKGFSFGKLQDRLAHDRAINFASAEFHERYSIRVVDEQDDIALYELFSTTFIDSLTARPVFWEQRGHDLIVFEKGHKTSAKELDAIARSAIPVLTRYLEEHK